MRIDWTPEETQTLLQLIETNPKFSYRQYADSLKRKFGRNYTSESVRSHLKRLKRKVSPPTTEKLDYKESTEIHKDGTQSSNKLLKMSFEESKDVNFLLREHGYDLNVWELVSARNNIWQVYSKQDGVNTLYSSCITVRPRKHDINLEEVKLIFVELGKNYQSPIHKPARHVDNGKLLEVNVTDLHIGKLAESDANDLYNLSIAQERFYTIINGIIERTQGQQFEKIVFVFSHDFFHVDNEQGATTAGTRQDVTGRWQGLYKAGTKMLIEGIDLLSQVAPLTTFYVGANHDKMMSYFAVEHIAAWYRNNPHVTVDTDPRIRKYLEYGKNLICFTHGNFEGKRARSIMPIEAREAWGRTIYHEQHQGHIHSEKAYIVEENGIIIRHLSSPSGTDNWHYESGYVGAVKKSQNFIWDKENGLETILNITF